MKRLFKGVLDRLWFSIFEEELGAIFYENKSVFFIDLGSN